MSKLLYRSIAPVGSKMSEKHILIRVIDYLPTLLLTRKYGKPVDLLVRVPLSSLTSTSINSKLLSANKQKIELYKLNWKTLNNARFFYVPKRNFGLSRQNPPFGHAKIPGRIQFLEAFILVFGVTMMLTCFVDWRKLKEDYGIDPLPSFVYDAYTNAPVDVDGKVCLLIN